MTGFLNLFLFIDSAINSALNFNCRKSGNDFFLNFVTLNFKHMYLLTRCVKIKSNCFIYQQLGNSIP